ncbi:MAG TPA: hypothetical protein VJB16_01470, partial [archaeon]|nr:hypothetical protein [archaeon]
MMEDEERSSFRALGGMDEALHGRQLGPALFEVGERLGARSNPAFLPFYGTNGAVFSAAIRPASSTSRHGVPRLCLKVVFNVQDIPTTDVREHFHSEIALTEVLGEGRQRRLPRHANVLSTFGHFVGAASSRTLGAAWDLDLRES